MKVLSGLLTVMGVAMMSSTIVSVALPQIIGALKGTQSQYTWVVTAMLLTSTVSTPLWGRLADLFSKKLLLQVGIVIFLLASLGAGFAQNTGQLIFFRAVQGLGMGAVQVLIQVVIAAMISPKDRGKYNGYLGGVMAVATVGGPLIGGFITDSALGWRWCFFLPLPFIAIAFFLLQKTLHLPVVRRDDVKIDYLGATLIAAGVSVLLVWITFVGGSFAWLSWQTAAMVGASAVLLVLSVWVETRAAQPVVPVHIVRQRTPALAIIGSAAVGMAMFGGAVFLGQYFQIGRGYSPTEAGLLTIPMMLGVLVSSTISGRIISNTGKVKPHIIIGLAVLTAGFLAMSTIDHETSLIFVGAAMVAIGTGVGMSMQNLVLIVQNDVSMRDMGAASGAMAFFRSLGGTIGVSVLGAILATKVAESIKKGFAEAGVPVTGDQGGSLDIAAIPEPLREIVRAAYGDGTGHIFLVSTGIAVVGLIAVLFLKPRDLRDSLDLHETPAPAAATPAPAAQAPVPAARHVPAAVTPVPVMQTPAPAPAVETPAAAAEPIVTAGADTAGTAAAADGLSDAEAVARSLREPEVFAVLLDRYYARVHEFASSWLAEDAAASVAADTFLTAFDRRHRYDPEGPAGVWLFAIAAKKVRRQWLEDGKRRDGRDGSPRPVGLEEEHEARLTARLAELSPGARDVLLLVACADVGYAEVAAALDLPVAAVESRLKNARDRFREALEQEGIDHG
ncbi:MFS transporter [Actinocorallia populi]|uniref:MFS transporter n=1 Tax=Actinocorallia populi TaxID=2079200 RepID=UPI001E551B02|nr:MFS transporter [Actinocorallia populi]